MTTALPFNLTFRIAAQWNFYSCK